MFKKITKNFLIMLLSKINIKDVINFFIKLEQKGNNFISLCPFHTEKTPSFFVNIDKQRYHCFGCHKSGDVIQFLINYKNITFYKAVYFLVNFIKLDKQYTILNIKEDLLHKASELYIKNLCSININVINFLKKRHLSNDMIKRFNLGFAKNSWSFLLTKLGTSHVRKLSLLNNGLIIKKGSKLYDRFRNRIIFPIKNINGVIIAFGARSLDDNIKPKYINSPETKNFSKKKELYGLYEALCNSKNKTIIIVEGYFDVITLHKYGITNVAAILGSFFSKDHYKKLSMLYDQIIFCYDNDKAGNLAAIRTAYSCLSYLNINVIVNFIFLPPKFDPDSFLNKGYKNDFLYLLDNSVYILDYIFNNISFNLDLNILKGKISLFNRLNKLLKYIPNNSLKTIILNHFMQKLGVSSGYNRKIIRKKKIDVLSLGMRACFFLLKNKVWVLQIDIKKLILNKKISFHSDLYIFFELIILLKNNINLNLNDLNKRLRRKIKINDFFNTLDLFPKDILEDEFFTLIKKILDINITDN